MTFEKWFVGYYAKVGFIWSKKEAEVVWNAGRRIGQEEMRGTVAAAAKAAAKSWGGIDAYCDDLEERLLALPLEGDDDV